MVLAKYFIKRFLKYFLLINIGITFLFNFIEFFEKIIRVKSATIPHIIKFIALQIPHTFFENFPISCWLASGLFIKEIIQHNEWEALQV